METVIWLIIYGLVGYFGLPILGGILGVLVSAIAMVAVIGLIFGVCKCLMPYIFPILIFLFILALLS